MPADAFRYERILPGPGAGLIINLLEDETRIYQDDAQRHCTRASGSVIGGPYRHSWIIDSAEQVRVMGVNFRPGGVHALLGIGTEELGLRDIDLEDLFGTGARRLRQRLLETACPIQRLAQLEQWLHTLCMRYRDAHAAIDWLCKAFGFERHAVYENEQGRVMHAQLMHGNGMLMLSDARPEGVGQYMAQPDEIGGRETQCVYVVVSDCKAHYERAKAAGVTVLPCRPDAPNLGVAREAGVGSVLRSMALTQASLLHGLPRFAPSPATVGEGWGGVACALACSRMSLWPLITRSHVSTSGSCRSLRSHPAPTLPYFAGKGAHHYKRQDTRLS